MVSSTPLPLWLQYQFTMRMCGQYSPSRLYKKKKIPILRIEPKFLRCPSRCLVTMLRYSTSQNITKHSISIGFVWLKFHSGTSPCWRGSPVWTLLLSYRITLGKIECYRKQYIFKPKHSITSLSIHKVCEEKFSTVHYFELPPPLTRHHRLHYA
jgi:hypothetical protein